MTIGYYSRRYYGLFLLPFLAACASSPTPYSKPQDAIREELSTAASAAAAAPVPNAASPNSLYPSMRLDVPQSAAKVVEPRFDLVVNDAPIRQVLLGMVAETRYSMLLPNDLEGRVTVSIKDVTVPEALSALRQLYGYEYRIEGNRIFVQSNALQTRIMKVNYLNTSRTGVSDIRVTSGSVADSSNQSNSSSSGSSSSSSNSSSSNTQKAFVMSQVETVSKSSFWQELNEVVHTIIGNAEGRSVVISPQSGVLVVRATPAELHRVEDFLKASQLSLERQVIIEAKIVEVTLSSNFQSGINWAAFGGRRFAVGQLNANSSINRNGTIVTTPISPNPLGSLANVSTSASTNGMFGMVLHASNFDAVLNMLEQQGRVHVLSSPRVATLNNQKAVLKVGTDDFFITGIDTSSSNTGNNNTSVVTPKLTLTPFFSGVALDVTPQIDDADQITLHVHPMVSKVSSVTQVIDMGDWGTFTLPLASSQVSEMDSMVRAQDGQMVALGGLIRQTSDVSDSQLPGLGEIPLVGNLFKQKSRDSERRELVILLRPTVIQGASSWADDIGDSESRVRRLLDEQAGPGSRPQ